MKEKNEKELDQKTLYLLLRRKLWSTTVLLIATLFSIILFTVAWFANNNRTASEGMAIESESPDHIYISESVNASRYYLAYDKPNLDVHFSKQEDGQLKVIEPEELISKENVVFLFDKMLPGEYVDITFSYTMSESMDGKNYIIYLDDFYLGEKPESELDAINSMGWFGIDDDQVMHYYNTLGVYKYQIISLVNGNDEVIIDKDNCEAAVFFSKYVADQDDEPIGRVVIYQSVWDKDDAELTITLRIETDFSQFYNLLKETGSNISNLLSQKGFVLNKIGVGLDR